MIGENMLNGIMRLHFIIGFICSVSICINAMQSSLTSPDSKKKKLEITIPLIPLTLNVFLQQPFCNIFVLCKEYSELREAAMAINSLAQVNKFLNVYFNDTTRTLDLIKLLSQQFNVANNIAARTFCTSAAKDRYFLQKNAIEPDCFLTAHLLDDIKLSLGKGLDLNFTYRASECGLIMPLFGLLKRIISDRKIIGFLAQNNIDIEKIEWKSFQSSSVMLQ